MQNQKPLKNNFYDSIKFMLGTKDCAVKLQDTNVQLSVGYLSDDIRWPSEPKKTHQIYSQDFFGLVGKSVSICASDYAV